MFGLKKSSSALYDIMFLISRIAAILERINKSLKRTKSETNHRIFKSFGTFIVEKKNFSLKLRSRFQ
ncbi:unnamed protein product [Caenorhabditis auriculariae]|uniref:Uncharacterized protein n=1 Tax=Caenorhabditis auriculariae TaxID=2777116 RepID=A0A8S1GW70_9PELO|nr:unnamed protein product [Caenorhabditis auriculariae]